MAKKYIFYIQVFLFLEIILTTLKNFLLGPALKTILQSIFLPDIQTVSQNIIKTLFISTFTQKLKAVMTIYVQLRYVQTIYVFLCVWV